ncbi:MAG: AmmeMemoRadiSam system protein B [Polyangiales bacterium]
MNAPAAETTRAPAVAGLFYPDGAKELKTAVDSLLAAASARAQSVDVARSKVKALIVPHAGYVYSGAIAATAYALLASRAQKVRRVVLLGPAHRAYVHGLAIPSAASFTTPLGSIEIDQAGVRAASQFPQVTRDDRAHAREHSLEVHLPFLQRTLGDFTLVPLVVGGATPTEVAQVLEALWGGDETLIVISSDLSHYQPYETATAVDRETVSAIVRGDFVEPEQACGAPAVNGLSALRRWRKLEPVVLDVRNSGDTAGGRDEVVGYASIALTEAGES